MNIQSISIAFFILIALVKKKTFHHAAICIIIIIYKKNKLSECIVFKIISMIYQKPLVVITHVQQFISYLTLSFFSHFNVYKKCLSFKQQESTPWNRKAQCQPLLEDSWRPWICPDPGSPSTKSRHLSSCNCNIIL